MAWAKLHDGHDENPKIDALSDAAFRLDINAITYACRNLTDGHLSDKRAHMLAARWKQPQRVINELVEKGRWHRTETGYEIHDFLIYNPSRNDVELQREQTRERVQRFRANTPNDPDGNGVTEGVSNSAPVPVPVPVPEISTNDDVPRTRGATEEDGGAVATILEINRNREAVEIVLHAMRRNPTLGWTFEARRCKAHYTSWQHWTLGQRALKFSDWLERQTRIEARDAARFQPPPQLAVVPSQEEPTAPPPKPEVWPHHDFPLWDDIQPALYQRVGAAAWHQRGWANVVPISFDEASGFLTLRPAPEMWEYRELLDSQLTMDVEQGAILMGQFGIRRVLWEPFRREATA